MIRNSILLIVLMALTALISLQAEPTPSADSTSSKKSNKAENAQSSKTNGQSKIVSAPILAEGWNYVKGEWIHSDGYKYVNGQVIRIGAQTHKRPPKPPSQALLNSVKKPASTSDPNSAAAKAAEKERNLRPRPAPQTGTHL